VRGEIVALHQPPTPLRTIIFDEGVWDEDIYIAPKPDGTVIIGATKADVGFDTSVSAGGVQHLLDVAIKLLPALANCQIARMWACLRPKTPDSRPLLGPLPGWSNVTVASGHGGFGVTLSIVTGEAIAELVATGQIPEIIRPFAPQGERGTHSNELFQRGKCRAPFLPVVIFRAAGQGLRDPVGHRAVWSGTTGPGACQGGELPLLSPERPLELPHRVFPKPG
jgi:FAD dependent oxidoreductase